MLPAGARLIHIGPQKTGTTSLQPALFAARESLPEHGAYVPRGSARRRRAGWVLGLPDKPPADDQSPWEKLTKEVARAGDLRVCVSNEDFARARPEQIDRIVDGLSRPGEAPYVVAVVRRLDLFLPSGWQQRVKGGCPLTFEDWLHVVLDEDGDEDHPERWNVWVGHDPARLAAAWLRRVPAENFMLVIADETDRSQQLRIFEDLLGLPTGLLVEDRTRTNPSLRAPEIEVVRQVANRWVERDRGPDAYSKLVTHGLLRALTNPDRPPSSPERSVLPEWARRRAAEISERHVQQIQQLPVRVMGDPEGLLVPPSPATVGPQPSPEQLLLPASLVAEALDAVFEAALDEDPTRPSQGV